MPGATSPRSSAAETPAPNPPRSPGVRFSSRFLQVNRFLNRPLAALLVRAIQPSRITPNQVTAAGFFIGLAAAGSFSLGRPEFFVLGGILAQASSLVDCADGMLARVRNQTSAYGAFLDLILDRINEFFLIAGAVFGFYRYSGSFRMLVLGLVTLGLYFLQVSIFYLTETYAGNGIRGRSAESRGLFIFLIFLFGVANRIDLGIYVLFGVSAAMNLCQLFSFLRGKKF